MIYTRPFTTRRFIAYAGDSWRKELSLVVQVTDEFTDQQPQVPLSVSLKELPQQLPFRNDHGFFCFEGRETVTIDGVARTRDVIPNGNYTLVVEPDPTSGNFFYLQPRPGDPWSKTFELSLTLPLPNPLQPLEAVTLSPTPSYPFPANATLVRGRVREGGVAAPDAVVSSTYTAVDPTDATQTVFRNVATLTDREGEFALFFKRLPLKTQTITITAVKNGPPVPVPNILITEGKTLKNQVISLP